MPDASERMIVPAGPAGPENAVDESTGAEAQGDHGDRDHGLDSGPCPDTELSPAKGSHHPVQTQAGHDRNHRRHQENRTEPTPKYTMSTKHKVIIDTDTGGDDASALILAAKSENIDKTRSSLLVEWLRVIRANKPKWGIYENVKNIVGKRFKETFQMFIDELHEYGYNTYYQVLNAKDYGIPQNRERVYLIIILKELDNGKFKFPKGFDNGKRLKDMLEDEVDEKYYINTPRAKELIDDLIRSGKLDKEYSNTVRSGGEEA